MKKEIAKMKTPHHPKGWGIFQQHREFSMCAIPRIEKYQTKSLHAEGYRKQIEPITSAISHQAKVKAIYLFGSQARGEAGPLSDIDLCVIAQGISEEEKNNILGYGSEKVDIVLFDDLPLTIKVRVFREGKLLYQTSQRYVDELAWRTTKEYFDFKPLLKKSIEVYLPGVHYV